MLIIDGSRGEGGGQVLRTALALSIVTQTPFQITSIRAGRARPGLLRQHLAGVQAAAAIGRAEVTGDTLHSTQLTFRPRGRAGGDHRIAIGSAGSAMLVIQAVLPALLVADSPSRLVIEGGTHNPASPPYDFVDRVLLPHLRAMGARVTLTLERHGFYPAGGGRVVLEVTPAPLVPIAILERGPVRGIRARAIVSGIPSNIGHRELAVLRERFALDREALVFQEIQNPVGPGNVALVEVECAHATEVFTSFGERNVRAETVARLVGDEARAWLDRDVPVGDHLADQLLVPMIVAGGGRFRTGPLTSHTTTNIEGIRRFVETPIGVSEVDGVTEVRVG